MPKGYNRKGYKKYKKAGMSSGLKTASKFLSAGEQALILARSAVKSISYIRGLVNSEMFKYDKKPNVFTTGIAGYGDTFVDIAQGDTDTLRTGNSLLVKAVRLDALIRMNGTTPNTMTYLRILIVKDSQEVSDLAQPNIADVLESTSDSSIIRSPLNSDTVGRFSILSNKVFAIDTYHPQKSIKMYVPMQHHVRYNGTASTDIQKGNIFFYVLCDGVSVGLNNPTCDLSTRTYYHDN